MATFKQIKTHDSCNKLRFKNINSPKLNTQTSVRDGNGRFRDGKSHQTYMSFKIDFKFNRLNKIK